jgi:ribosomal protein L29
MESKYVKLTLPRKLYQDSLKLVKEFGYSNIQDLTVDSLRKQTIELKKEQALINLKKNLGSVKPKQRLTKEQREKIAETSLTRAKEITKKYGLEDIKI